MKTTIQNRRQLIASLLVSIVAAGSFALTAAQGLSAKPITVLIPYPPGGPADLMARSVGEFVSERTGRPVIEEYKAGGGGQIAAAALLQAPADGSTLLVGEMSVLSSNKFLYPKFRYDPLVDFEAVAALPQMPVVLYVPYSSPFRSLDDLVAASKLKPLNYASQGAGSVGHLLGEMLASASGGQFNHVPYKGSAPAMTDLMGGQVDFMFAGIGPGLPHLASQKLRVISVAGPKRLPQIPGVATSAESGFPDVSLTVWFGAVVRAGTAAPVVRRLNEDIAYALSQPKIMKRFGDMGYQMVTMGPEEFGSFIRRESDRWGAFIKARRIVLD